MVLAGVAIALLGLAFAARVAAVAASSGEPLLGMALALPMLLELVVLGAGIWLLGTGWPGRAGRSLHCAKCNYQRIEETDRLLGHCPECGHTWRHFGGWRVGRPVGSRRRVRLGVGLCVVALAAMLARAYAIDWIAGRLPTGLVIRQVIYAPASTTEAYWKTLESRSLSAGERSWIVEGMLDRRVRLGNLDARAQAWLDKEIALTGAQAPPTAMVERYYAELADFELSVPTSVRIGQTIEASVIGRSHARSEKTPLGPAGAVVERVTFELPPPPAGSNLAASALPGLGIGTSSSLVSLEGLSANQPIVAVGARPEYEGTAKVTAVVWLVVGPETGEGVSFAEGELPRFRHAAERMKRVVLEGEVRVVR